ncbi:hypothetical protein MNBD_GAMMA12-1514 [hydrothermal vent metagenome]|uniref:Uncharacterized protein n=1 Tax=hydrothermal vent metagenome TaxID=652676 RepID=A0A3B0YZB2_9ZZZZ
MDKGINSTVLAQWHASPLDRSQAQVLLRETHQKRKEAILTGEQCWFCQTNEFIANYWLGKVANNSFEWLVRTHSEQRQRALLLLSYGQLLLSCKLNFAFEYLDQGLIQAADFLSPTDYFRVINRHELLSILPLFTDARTAADLPMLENEAKILSRLKQGQPRLTGNFGSTPRR